MPTICNDEHTATSCPSLLARRRPEIAMPKRYRTRPALIRRAIYQAWVGMDELGISVAGVAVLQALIASGVDTNNPRKTIYAKKASLARIAQVSESSVYRTLRILESKGFIERSEQQQRLDGSLAITQISLTDSMLCLLKLDCLIRISSDSVTDNVGSGAELEETDLASADQPPDATVAQAPLSHIVAVGLTHGLNDAAYIGEQKVDQKDEPKTTTSVHNQSTNCRHVKLGKFTIPVELVWLIEEKRLSPPQLFKLMKLAKTVPGQTITDYVELRRSRLLELSSIHDCYRFLKKLIDDQIDARFLVAQQRKYVHRIHRTQQKKTAQQDRYLWLRDRDGKTFIDPSTGKSYTINASHSLVSVGQHGQPSSQAAPMKINGRFIDRITSGELKQYVPPASDRIRDASHNRIQTLFDALKGRK